MNGGVQRNGGHPHRRDGWEGLYSLDLRSRATLKVADRESLVLPPPYTEGRVSSLLDVPADARELYCIVAVVKPDASARIQRVEHHLARMKLPTAEIDLITN